MTIYAFSIENFKRSKYEIDALMDMAKVKLAQLAQHGDLLDRYGASVRVLGKRNLLKKDVVEAIDHLVSMTAHNTRAILNICASYTSHDEIATAIRNAVAEYSVPSRPPLHQSFSESHITHTIRARHISARIRAHSPGSGSTSDAEDSSITTMSSSTTLHPESPPEALAPSTENTKEYDDNLQGRLKPPQQSLVYPDPETITALTLDEHMFTAGLPPLELLVRTSGVERLSDFMLWQCHRDTEIVFLKCLWPEFDLWNFLPVLVEWQWRKRKAGEGKTWGAGAGLGIGIRGKGR